MRQIVAAVLPREEGVILDPFMGSGATIAAAHALGFRSIGLEISPEYYRLAKRGVPRLAAVDVTTTIAQV
jgi:site-specific DNA-methyltransferase (adenine-specific)